MASLLAAHQVPDSGGGTEFADMRAAYDNLEAEMQAWLEDKVAVHSYLYSQGLVGGLAVLTAEEQTALPPVEHAMVRRHPKTGRKNLYIGRHASHIKGRDEGESRALLQDLVDNACQTPCTITHFWRAGDLVIWANRCTLHRRDKLDPQSRRPMHRTQVRDEVRPVAAWANG